MDETNNQPSESGMTYQDALVAAISSFAGTRVPHSLVHDHIVDRLSEQPEQVPILDTLIQGTGNHSAFPWLDQVGAVEVAEAAARKACDRVIPNEMETLQIRLPLALSYELEQIRQREYPFFNLEDLMASIIEDYVADNVAIDEEELQPEGGESPLPEGGE